MRSLRRRRSVGGRLVLVGFVVGIAGGGLASGCTSTSIPSADGAIASTAATTIGPPAISSPTASEAVRTSSTTRPPRSAPAPKTAVPPATGPARTAPKPTPATSAAKTTAATTLPSAGSLPLAYRGSAGQLITVVASSAAATSATLTAWQRTANGWRIAAGPVFAWVGYGGTGATREGMSRTPAGAFPLTQAFGNQPNNGTRMPYFQAGRNDWWDENPASPTYNRHVLRTSSPGGASENLFDSGPAYAHAVNIDYNTDPVVPGAGSAFFLHVTEGHPTQGCVSIAAGQLDVMMRWLDPGQHPAIVLGVR